MPKVGSKQFSYDAAGVEKAKKESEKTGIPVEFEDRNYGHYAGGDRVSLKPEQKKKGKKKHLLEKDVKVPLLGDVTLHGDVDIGKRGGRLGLTKRFSEGGKIRGAGAATRGLNYKG